MHVRYLAGTDIYCPPYSLEQHVQSWIEITRNTPTGRNKVNQVSIDGMYSMHLLLMQSHSRGDPNGIAHPERVVLIAEVGNPQRAEQQ